MKKPVSLLLIVLAVCAVAYFALTGKEPSPRPANIVRSGGASSGGGTTRGETGRGPLEAGKIYWGADGHRDQGGVYDTALSQQIADLKNIFGTAPDTILYRALGEGQSVARAEADARELRAAGIFPILVITAYPPFDLLSNEQAAYDWAYNTASNYAQGVPDGNIIEIGNEWTIYEDFGIKSVSGDYTDPDTWRRGPYYRRMLGVIAGAVAAIRDTRPDAAVIGGATNGWTQIGLPIALGVDLKNYNGRDLSWDYTVLHWYNDVNGYNHMGDPSNYKGGNVYAKYKFVDRPIAVTEFGSNGATIADGNSITQTMSYFFAHVQASGSEPGVSIGTIYQLYPNGGEGYQLYSSPGNISAAGGVVKSWIAQHGTTSSN